MFTFYRAGVIEEALAALEVEKAHLFTECDKAQELEKIAEVSTKTLTRRERWRIPIVFIKVSNSKRLNAPDAKIWSAVTQNMRTEEDAVRMSAVLTLPRGKRSISTSAAPSLVATACPSRTSSFSGNHHVITPCVTPRNHNAAQSKLHQATSASRHRTEAAQASAGGVHLHSLSRQNSRQSSFRQTPFRGDHHIGTTDADGNTKEEATCGSPMNKRRVPHTPKRSTKSRGGKKGNRRSLMSRLRKSLNFATTLTSQQGGDRSDSAGQTDGDGNAAGSTVTPDDSGDCESDHEQSALQLMIAGLAALNTSLRASFGGVMSLSGKYGGTSGKSQQSGSIKLHRLFTQW